MVVTKINIALFKIQGATYEKTRRPSLSLSLFWH